VKTDCHLLFSRLNELSDVNWFVEIGFNNWLSTYQLLRPTGLTQPVESNFKLVLIKLVS
jgi:hypothetical protein